MRSDQQKATTIDRYGASREWSQPKWMGMEGTTSLGKSGYWKGSKARKKALRYSARFASYRSRKVSADRIKPFKSWTRHLSLRISSVLAGTHDRMISRWGVFQVDRPPNGDFTTTRRIMQGATWSSLKRRSASQGFGGVPKNISSKSWILSLIHPETTMRFLRLWHVQKLKR